VVLGLSWVVLVAAVLVPGVHATPGTSSLDFTLHLDGRSAPQIAGHRVATLPQAVRAFGRPANVSSVPGTAPACKASWPTLGLTIDFSAAEVAACAAPKLGAWVAVTATSPRWHTNAGLHVGDPQRRLQALYPQARRLDFLGKGPTWELETGGPYCDGGPPLALAAQVRANHVSALAVLHVPACG